MKSGLRYWFSYSYASMSIYEEVATGHHAAHPGMSALALIEFYISAGCDDAFILVPHDAVRVLNPLISPTYMQMMSHEMAQVMFIHSWFVLHLFTMHFYRSLPWPVLNRDSEFFRGPHI